MDTLIDVSRKEGVKDLPLSVRRWFAKALIAERLGEHSAAAEYLATAIAEEAKHVKG